MLPTDFLMKIFWGGGSACGGVYMQGGGVCIQGGLPGGSLPMGGLPSWCLPWGGALHPGGSASSRSWADPSQSGTTGYGQCAGGTHPTGMHSCFIFFWEFYGNEASTSVSFVKMNWPKGKAESKSHFNYVLHPPTLW